MSTTTFADRLKELMYYYRLNKNSLSVKLGFTANTSITRLANHPERLPSFDILLSILSAFPEVNARWLILGEDEMLTRGPTPMKTYWTSYFKHVPGQITTGQVEPTDKMRVIGYADCDLAYDIFGDSMAPRILSGDMIICKEVRLADPITFGEIYLIFSMGEPVVRYIKNSTSEGVFRVGTENPRNEDYEIRREDIMALYRVKGLIRRVAI